MTLKIADAPLPKNIYKHASGGYEGKVAVGTGATACKESKYFTADTPFPVMETWVAQTRERLRTEHDRRAATLRGTLRSARDRYLAIATLSTENRKNRTRRLDFFMAQPAALAAPVLTPEQVRAEAAARARGESTPERGKLLGEVLLVKVPDQKEAVTIDGATLERIRRILAIAFEPTDPEGNPTEFAETSNHYRQALVHMFTIVNRNVPNVLNPMSLVETRATAAARPSGVDMRLVREILKEFPAEFGRSSVRSQLRLAVLAYVHITPKQLSQLNPATDFHDREDASREDILRGVVTLTKAPRMKGRRKTVPAPETIPLTPYGVAAMRAFAADERAHGKFSLSPLNKNVKKAAARVQADLAARGVSVDLSGFTLYHLKHSLASAASFAAAGAVDRSWKVQQNDAVRIALDHGNADTTAIYTRSADWPILVMVNRKLTEFLDELFTKPLTALKVVKTGTGGDGE